MIQQILHENCLRCGRKLRTEESKKLGFGKICWEKYNEEDEVSDLFSFETLIRCNTKYVQSGSLLNAEVSNNYFYKKPI